MRGVIRACAEGAISPHIAAVRLILHANSAEALDLTLSHARQAFGTETPQADRMRRAGELVGRNRRRFDQVKTIAAAADHADARRGVEALSYWAAVFDRAAAISPEASVALYSLGDRALLDEATEEIATVLGRWGALGRTRHALDLGCGIGRCMERLARDLASIVGVELSPAMAQAARARCAGLANASLVRTGGEHLRMFRDGSFDLVLAVDTFPYLVHAGAGIATTHMHEIGRVLRPGGDFILFNFSYRDDEEGDRREVFELASEAGFACLRNGERPFRLWDALAFHLSREAPRLGES